MDIEPALAASASKTEASLHGAMLKSRVAELLVARDGEFAVLGLGVSGEAVARLLHAKDIRVYASDNGDSPAVHEAAERLRALGIATEAGAHDLPRIARSVCVVASPGISPQVDPIVAARSAGVPIVSEVEIGLQLQPDLRYIAVTGTNGKTTTTSLIAHLLQALGKDVVEAGNIGTPVSELAFRDVPPEWMSLELSSFQLHDTPSVNPTVGVLTNLSPDHLDRYHDSVAEYYADKALLFANAASDSRWVLPADGPAVLEMTHNLAGQSVRFSATRTDVEGYLDTDRGQLVVLGEALAPRSDFPLPGDHNVENVLAALLAVMTAHPTHATPAARVRLAAAIQTVKALPHRIEPVADENHVLWLNDSKATNISSTLVAIAGMTRPTVLLLGGRHKGEPYDVLANPISAHGRAVIAFGEAAPIIVEDLTPLLSNNVPLHDLRHASFAEVMRKAHELAQPGDAVLLSPACSSYDMFANYKERGYMFTKLAKANSASVNA